jgi:AcrR family transcriptional regulator
MSEDLPDDVALLWGKRGGAARPGPKPALSVDDIVKAAVAIADAEGLPAVTMPRVAAELGNSTMALYRHVRGKDELLLLMGDAGMASPPELPVAEGWRPALAAWAGALRAMLLEHPWYAKLPISGPPVGPQNLAWFDRGLGTLAGTRIDEGVKVAIILNVLTYVHGEVRLSIGLMEGYRDKPEIFGEYGAVLARVVDATALPSLHAVMRSGVFDEDLAPEKDMDSDFEFGLAMVLDGVAACISQFS